jgi:Glycosyl hydrolase family 115/Gylcosyl hydrolase family 115 C-terminal domain
MKPLWITLLVSWLALLLSPCLRAEPGLGLPVELVVEQDAPPGSFPLVSGAGDAPLWHDPLDHKGVVRAIGDLQADIERVTGRKPELVTTRLAATARPVIIGTLGKSALIDALVKSGKLDASDLAGKWESFVITTVDQPEPGIEQALVIAGSDKRGTIYGIYELSAQLGVSPWYWWADVPVKKHSAAYVVPGRFASGEPAVKYRGIFLNDEHPALSPWVNKTFGGYNSAFYTKVFELLLRMRGNYLWPAMWNNAFNEDDPLNPVLADDYGIVMGTSHHEPMLRAHKEWTRRNIGPWDYTKNEEVLKNFFAEGIRRNRDHESLTTIGMRGDGDTPMSESANVALLERIVADQRVIIARETGKPAEQVPQVWALYKEVQEYYEKGMRVPDDVTLLWCDDNWGNIRRLPTPAERARSGGAGVYYHFDYVGGPRNYKWVNTNPLPRVQEQMNLAWQYGADRLWIVNVGDLKPMEVPMEFFLRMAWDPARWPAERCDEFLRVWAAREFGPEHATEVAALVAGYAKFNGWRKPELLDAETFSVLHYREAERVVAGWRDLERRAQCLSDALPDASRDAFFQLVLSPIRGCANVTELHVATALNRLYAKQGRASANELAARARALFQADADLTNYWNTDFAGGKWVHMMDEIRIGYTSWNSPKANIMPELAEVAPSAAAEIGVVVEGAADPLVTGRAVRLPAISSEDCAATRRIEIFRRGTAEANYSIRADRSWVKISSAQGRLGPDARVEVGLDWRLVPVGDGEVRLNVRGSGDANYQIVLPYSKAPAAPAALPKGFLELDGYVAIDALHFDQAVPAGEVTWKVLPDLGRGPGAVTAFPVTAASRLPDASSARLDYNVYLRHGGAVTVRLIASPTLGFTPGRGLRCAVSFDDQPPQVVDFLADRSYNAWDRAVRDNAWTAAVALTAAAPGLHVLKFWFVDPAVVLQRIEIDTGGLKPTYLGPPESPRGRRVPAGEHAITSPSARR